MLTRRQLKHFRSTSTEARASPQWIINCRYGGLCPKAIDFLVADGNLTELAFLATSNQSGEISSSQKDRPLG